LHVNLTTFFCSSYIHGGLQRHCISKNDSHSLYIVVLNTRHDQIWKSFGGRLKIRGAHGFPADASPVGSSSLIRSNRWQMPDSLFTQLFSPSPPPPGSFLVITDRLWRHPELRASTRQSTGIIAVCASTNRSHRSNPTIIQAGSNSGNQTFVAFSSDLPANLANCNVLARTKLLPLGKSHKSASIRNS